MAIVLDLDLDELTDVVSSWISYCQDAVIPDKVVKIYPNSKPWVSKHLKLSLKKKKSVFKMANLSELISLQKDIKHEIKRANLCYKQKVERKLGNNNLRSAWHSVKTIVELNCMQEFNKFYSRFDVHDFSKETAALKGSLLNYSHFISPFSVHSVVNIFKHCTTNTSPGPDSIGSRLLIHCADQ